MDICIKIEEPCHDCSGTGESTTGGLVPEYRNLNCSTCDGTGFTEVRITLKELKKRLDEL